MVTSDWRMGALEKFSQKSFNIFSCLKKLLLMNHGQTVTYYTHITLVQISSYLEE